MDQNLSTEAAPTWAKWFQPIAAAFTLIFLSSLLSALPLASAGQAYQQGQAARATFEDESRRNGVAVQDHDAMIVARVSDAGGLALARYRADGTADEGFGYRGEAITLTNSPVEKLFAVATQADGKLVVAAFAAGTGGDLLLARYTADGAPDAEFGEQGTMTTDLAGFFALAAAQNLKGRFNEAVGGAGGATAGVTPYFIAVDLCVQDDTVQRILAMNSVTGVYFYSDCSKSIFVAGRGAVTRSGCKLWINGSGENSSVSALVNVCTKTANAAITVTVSNTSPPRTFKIADTNMNNSRCFCAGNEAR